MGQALDSGIQGARFMAHGIIEGSDTHLIDNELNSCGYLEGAVIIPSKGSGIDNHGASDRAFNVAAIGVIPAEPLRLVRDHILVFVTRASFADLARPIAVPLGSQWISCLGPIIEISADVNGLGVRCPNPKGNATFEGN